MAIPNERLGQLREHCDDPHELLSQGGLLHQLTGRPVERSEQVAAPVPEEAETVRRFFADTRPPTSWTRNGSRPSRGRGSA